MITVENLSLQFGGQKLFDRVDLQFIAGNCYGIIGANGAGKSTFLNILSGELTNYEGTVNIDKKRRMSVLKQNQNMYDEYSVMDTVIMGNKRLYDCGKEKDAIYDKPDFSDEDGIHSLSDDLNGFQCSAMHFPKSDLRLLQFFLTHVS